MSSKKTDIYKTFVRIFSRVGKRKRFIIATIILTVLVSGSTFASPEQSHFFLAGIMVAAFILTFFSILEGITRHEWLTLFLPPVYFTAAAYLFYFFLPQRWLTRLPFSIFFAISIYALMLSQNIFNVGATKSLQLFRAASSINFLFLTFSSYLAYSLILSFRLDFSLNFLFVFLATAPLALHFLWSINPDDIVRRDIRRFAIVIALIISEGTLLLSFISVNPAIFALFLTASFYSLCGLFQVYLQQRLFIDRVREYLFVLIFVFIILLLAMG